MPSAKKPPSDPAVAARSILDQVTGEKLKVMPHEKNASAVALGREGGKARALATTPEARKRMARAAARKRWRGNEPEDRVMDETTKIALKNFDWLMRNRTDVGLFWDTGTVAYGDGGADINELCKPGFTPATG